MAEAGTKDQAVAWERDPWVAECPSLCSLEGVDFTSPSVFPSVCEAASI